MDVLLEHWNPRNLTLMTQVSTKATCADEETVPEEVVREYPFEGTAETVDMRRFWISKTFSFT